MVSEKDDSNVVKAPKVAKVAVIGGGVTGMTAAHELAERNFDVTLFEKTRAYALNGKKALALGGLARSQYVRDDRDDDLRIYPFKRALVHREWNIGPDGTFPGEHGFRLFPSFYRHVFDTMRRIPLGESTLRTVYDNLVPTRRSTVAAPGQPPRVFAREPTKTAKMMYDNLQALLSLGGTPQDLAYFCVRLVRYLCTSLERRAAECENRSFLQYIRGEGEPLRTEYEYSQAFLDALNFEPRVLVAFDACDGDARTTMSVAVQMFLDNVEVREKTDGTLNGPTSETWFEPWKAHLERLGVCFRNAEVKHFLKPEQALGRGIPELECLEKGAPLRPTEDRRLRDGIVISWKELDDASGSDDDRQDDQFAFFDYVVVATDAVSAETLAESLWRVLSDEREPASPLAGFTTVYPPQTQKAGAARNPYSLAHMGRDERDRLQTMTSIQFFFPGMLALDYGHMFYSASPWGLSSICQQEFWHTARTSRDGRFSVLSVDITRLDKPCDGKTFYECTRQQIAERCWEQIRRCLNDIELPEPHWFHIDDNIVFSRDPVHGDERPELNLTPYLVPIVGDWQYRPGGDPWSPAYGYQRRNRGEHHQGPKPPSAWCAEHGGYWVHFDRVVFAGSYTRTFTRLTTMEASNESGRHAVNAILDHLLRSDSLKACGLRERNGVQKASPLEEGTHDPSKTLYRRPTPLGDYCVVWNMEELEPDLFEPLKALDAKLFAQGKPHLFDLLGLELLPRLGSRWRPSDGKDPWTSLLQPLNLAGDWMLMAQAFVESAADWHKIWTDALLGGSFSPRSRSSTGGAGESPFARSVDQVTSFLKDLLDTIESQARRSSAD